MESILNNNKQVFAHSDNALFDQIAGLYPQAMLSAFKN